MNDKISVVVPVYNVENYLDKCIESLVNQTYKNIEIILVNDGSTDNSGQKCLEWAQKHDNIMCLEKKNGGLSDARNYAFKYCTGKYITFVDSDDYVDADYVELLYKNLKDTDSDISCVNYICFYEDGIFEKKSIRSSENKVYNNINAIIETLYQDKISNAAWAKLYKIELFKDIRFPFGKLCEDLGTTYKLFYKCNKICATEVHKYNYLQRNNSIMRSKFNVKKMDALEFALEIYDFARDKDKKLREAAKVRICSECLGLLNQMPKGNQYLEQKTYVKKVLKKYKNAALFNSKTNIKFKIKILLNSL